MTPHEEKAASLSRDEIVALLVKVEELQGQLDWFRRQLFGAKSERRLSDAADGLQLHLGEQLPCRDTSRSHTRP